MSLSVVFCFKSKLDDLELHFVLSVSPLTSSNRSCQVRYSLSETLYCFISLNAVQYLDVCKLITE